MAVQLKLRTCIETVTKFHGPPIAQQQIVSAIKKVPYLGLVIELAFVAFDDSCSWKRNERVSFNVSWTDVFQTPKNPAYQVFAQRHHPGCPSALFILWPKVDKHDQFAKGYFGIFFKKTVGAKTPLFSARCTSPMKGTTVITRGFEASKVTRKKLVKRKISSFTKYIRSNFLLPVYIYRPSKELLKSCINHL